MKILQVNFNYTVSRTELEAIFGAAAEHFAAVPGCRWKIWLVDDARKETGGIYLFDDQASIDRMLAGPLIAAATSNPAFKNFSVKTFDVAEAASRVTGAPLNQTLAAGR